MVIDKFRNICIRCIDNKPINNSDISDAYQISGYVKDCDMNEFVEAWNLILKSKWSSHILKRLDRLQILDGFFPELTRLKKVPQDKRKTLDAFQHTLKVLNEVDKRHDDVVMKWAAIFHDIGKAECVDNFHYHEYKSEILVGEVLSRMAFIDKKHFGKLFDLVRYHMWPLGYQREQNYNDSTILKFCDKISLKNDVSVVSDIIDLAICDKLATHNKEEYIKPLLELKERVFGLINERQ